MAFSPPASNSIAARPTIKKGGVRGVDEDPGAFRQRMDARQSSNPAPAGAGQPGGVTPPTRRDNIVAARADGTFNTKRDTFNQANTGSGKSMDEAGNITGSSAPKPAGMLVPGRSAGSSVWQPTPPAPAAPAAAGAVPPPPGAPPGTPAAPPTATAPPPAPAAAASNGGIPAPSGTVQPPPPAPASPPKPASPAPATPMARPPAAPTAPPTSTPYAQAAINRATTAIAPPPPRPAIAAAAPAAAAPVAAARKPGMINDGQGFKPAAQVNAALRTAQDLPAGAASPPPATPPPPSAMYTTRGKMLLDPAPGKTSQQLGQQIADKRAQFAKNQTDLAAIQAKKKDSITPPPPKKIAAAPTPPAPQVKVANPAKSALHTGIATAKPKPIPDEMYSTPALDAVKGAGSLVKSAFNGVSHMGEKIAKTFDESFINRPPGVNPPIQRPAAKSWSSLASTHTGIKPAPAKSIPRLSPGIVIGR